MRGGSRQRLLDIEQAQRLILVGRLSDTYDDGVPKVAQGTAPFHPIRGIEHANGGVVIARTEHSDKLTDFLAFDEVSYLSAFLLRKRPEALAQRDRRGLVVDPLFSQRLPRARQR